MVYLSREMISWFSFSILMCTPSDYISGMLHNYLRLVSALIETDSVSVDGHAFSIMAAVGVGYSCVTFDRTV